MNYQIKIPKPCTEKWNEMTPTDKGAFCLNCQIEVIDFSTISNDEVVKFKDGSKKLCGKFKPEQLDRIKSNGSSCSSNYSKAGIVFGLSGLLSLTNPLSAQNEPKEANKTEQQSVINKKDETVNSKVADSIQIKGQVFKNDLPLQGASVVLKGSNHGTQTNKEGKFSIKIKAEEMEKNPTLQFSYIGLKSKDIRIKIDTEFLKVRLEEDDFIIGEVVFEKKNNIFRKIGNLFRKE
jgi:hypothetical protein